MANKPVGSVRQPASALPKPGPAKEEKETTSFEQPQEADRASLFDESKPESGFGVPPGDYVAILAAASHEKDGQKESIKFGYEIAEGESEGKNLNAWYNLFDTEGKPQRGMGFFKRDMEVLGQAVPTYDELEDGLRALADERLRVIVTVKQNGQWTNLFLKGLE